EHPRGVRLEADSENSDAIKAFVVAADLTENGRELSIGVMRDLLNLRVAKAYLRQVNLILPGAEHAETNEGVLQRFLLSVPRTGELAWTDLNPLLDRLEAQAGEGASPIINPSEQAFLHRILRGRISDGAAERRTQGFQDDLRAYAGRTGTVSLLPELQAALETYMDRASHPSLHFDREVFETALNPSASPEGAAPLVREHLSAFLKSLGLPSGDNGSSTPTATVEGVANLSFLGYLAHFRENHPLRWQGQLIEDPALLERLVADRLVDAPSLTPHRERVLTQMRRLLTEYNRRTPPLRILEIAAQGAHPQDPLVDHPLNRIYDETLEGLERHGEEIFSPHSRRLIYTSLSDLRETLAHGEHPSSERIEQSFRQGLRRLEEAGIVFDPALHSDHLKLLNHLVERSHRSIESVERLAASLGDFVRSRDYHSGLDSAPDFSREMARIFRRHLASALLDAEPVDLPSAIAAEIQGRFGPFPTIREDLIRGLKIIYHEGLQDFRDRYEQLLSSFEMSREEAVQHGNRERFRNDLVGLASEVLPNLNDFSDLLRRAEDLEVLLSLLPNGPQMSLAERVHQAEGHLSMQNVLSPRTASMTSRPPATVETKTPPVPPALPSSRPPPPLGISRVLAGRILPSLLQRLPESLPG